MMKGIRTEHYPLWWPSLTKDMQIEQLLCWSVMTDTEHIISGSNEEDFVDVA